MVARQRAKDRSKHPTMESTAGVQRDHKDDVQTRCPSTLDNTIEALSDDDSLTDRIQRFHLAFSRDNGWPMEDKIAFGQISTGVRWHSMFKGFEASRRAQSGKWWQCRYITVFRVSLLASGVDATTPTPRYHSRQDISTDGYNAVGSPLGFAKRP
ncbi:hypothetical protein HZH68_001420 [Vespula germanica]|uniref:Uncharacterized protein n=1 Tax=Vespula germanica TaxID=30212 RepID=A0A834NVK8_VESGE|nr:hypothetical protein HZH68_001420 [Vespula germanica]